MVLCTGLRFFALRLVSQNKLSKTTLENVSNFSPCGQKVTRSRKKVKKNSQKKNLKDLTKWNRKMGGRSCFITSGAFGHGLLCIVAEFDIGGSLAVAVARRCYGCGCNCGLGCGFLFVSVLLFSLIIRMSDFTHDFNFSYNTLRAP